MATEKRLIDANVAIERAKNSDKIVRSSVWETGEVVEFLEDCPIVDAVEVVHGYWKLKHDPTTDPKRYFIRIVCSECDLHTGQRSNYCPQCGAKMDGDGNG